MIILREFILVVRMFLSFQHMLYVHIQRFCSHYIRNIRNSDELILAHYKAYSSSYDYLRIIDICTRPYFLRIEV